MKMKLNNVRLAFPTLFVPEPYEPGSIPRYGCSLLVDKEDAATVTKVEQAIEAVAREQWGKRWDDERFRRSVKMHAWRDGDEKDYDGFAGCMYVSANRSEKQGRPTVIDADKTPLAQSDGRPYGGCYVNAIVSFYADTRHGSAVNCSLAGIQFFRDGPGFGGGEAASPDEFDDESEGAELLG